MSDLQPEVKTENVPEPEPVDVVVSTELKNIIEALIFASDEPMTVRFIRSIMDDVNKDLPPAEHYSVNADIIRKAVADLNRGYAKLGTGFRIIEIAGGFTHATQEQFSSWVGKLAKEKARRRLSPTAVETLAIIAYKQPIAKGEVEFIRGVNVDYIINALLEKDLIHITGRANSPGRPLLYGTTQKFLEHFGLNDLTDLPKPREIAELINETELEVDRRLLAEQQELEFKEDLEKKMDGNEGSKNKPQKKEKIKVPDGIKEENRRAGQQSGTADIPADDKAADGQRSAEGESSSESNSTINEAAAQALENVQEVQAMHEQDRSAANGPASPAPADGRTAEHHDRPLEQQEAEETGDVPEERTTGAVHGRETDAPEDSMTEGQGSRANDGPEVLTTADPEHREDTGNVPPVHSAPSVPENSATVPEHRHGSAPEQAQITGGDPQPEVKDEAREVSGSLTADEQARAQSVQDQLSDQGTGQPTGQATGQSTGWSKWKNKVKTFFQKLFA